MIFAVSTFATARDSWIKSLMWFSKCSEVEVCVVSVVGVFKLCVKVTTGCTTGSSRVLLEIEEGCLWLLLIEGYFPSEILLIVFFALFSQSKMEIPLP